MAVEGLSAPALVFHDACACPGIGNGPIEHPVFKEIIHNELNPLGQVVPTRPRSSRPMPLRTSQTVMAARPIPCSATESRNLATRGFGLGRIISDTTFVSRSQATAAVNP